MPQPTAWLVYMLRCADGSLYTGCTNDLTKRLSRHSSGKGAAYTRSRLPVRVVFQEPVEDRSAALRREASLKRLTRLEKLALVKSTRAALRKLRREGAKVKKKRVVTAGRPTRRAA